MHVAQQGVSEDLPTALALLLDTCKESAEAQKECTPGEVVGFRRTLYKKEVSDALMKHVPVLQTLHRELAFPYFRVGGRKKVCGLYF